jgi:secondary thiamine-phosphate synthase enzyme
MAIRPSSEENDMVKTGSIQLSTRGNADVKDITAEIARVVSASELKNGIVTIFCPSATSALTTIEYESGCVSDLRRLFDEIIPQNREYAHNARWHDGNGHSHVRAALLGPSLTIPFVEGSLTLGTWQQIIHVDFDVRSRHRELVLQIIGE